MKKHYFKMMMVAMAITLLSGNAFTASAGLPIFDKEIAMRDASDPVDPEQERSLIKTTQAFLYTSRIEVQFNKNIGEATVLILNSMNTVVESKTFDTDFGSTIELARPTAKGNYTIYIVGSNGYQGDGSFSNN